MESIHGHQVLSFIKTLKGKKLVQEQLIALLEDEFGDDAVFHTCSLQNLSIEELIDVLEGKNKIKKTKTGYSVVEENVCS